MPTQTSHDQHREKEKNLEKKESKSFDDMSAESRKESGEVLLSIDARAGSEATEIIDSFETGEVSEVAGEDKKKKPNPESAEKILLLHNETIKSSPISKRSRFRARK
jgi:hypothetical protein